eukprot:jgi/Mesen1/2385/ME001565S01384
MLFKVLIAVTVPATAFLAQKILNKDHHKKDSKEDDPIDAVKANAKEEEEEDESQEEGSGGGLERGGARHLVLPEVDGQLTDEDFEDAENASPPEEGEGGFDAAGGGAKGGGGGRNPRRQSYVEEASPSVQGDLYVDPKYFGEDAEEEVESEEAMKDKPSSFDLRSVKETFKAGLEEMHKATAEGGGGPGGEAGGGDDDLEDFDVGFDNPLSDEMLELWDLRSQVEDLQESLKHKEEELQHSAQVRKSTGGTCHLSALQTPPLGAAVARLAPLLGALSPPPGLLLLLLLPLLK